MSRGEHWYNARHLCKSEQNLLRRYRGAVLHAIGRPARIEANDHVAALDLPENDRPVDRLERRRDEIGQRFGYEVRRRRLEHRRRFPELLCNLIAPGACSIEHDRRFEGDVTIGDDAKVIAKGFERHDSRVLKDVCAKGASRSRDRWRSQAWVRRAVPFRPRGAACIGAEPRKAPAQVVCADQLDVEARRSALRMIAFQLREILVVERDVVMAAWGKLTPLAAQILDPLPFL